MKTAASVHTAWTTRMEWTEGNNMAGYQALYSLEAVYRLKAGQCRVFDLSNDVA
ncbi:MAG: hypothetical protein V8S96_06085 [Lachnospiraceae bacterium]